MIIDLKKIKGITNNYLNDMINYPRAYWGAGNGKIGLNENGEIVYTEKTNADYIAGKKEEAVVILNGIFSCQEFIVYGREPTPEELKLQEEEYLKKQEEKEKEEEERHQNWLAGSEERAKEKQLRAKEKQFRKDNHPRNIFWAKFGGWELVYADAKKNVIGVRKRHLRAYLINKYGIEAKQFIINQWL